MSRATRWAGVSPTDRRAERRSLLLDAAFTLFGDHGEAAVTVRSVCRVSELHTRYFYENFSDTDELLGAVYDSVGAQLAQRIADALAAEADHGESRLRAGIRAVLEFSSADPRRGSILFTEGRTNQVLAERRTKARDQLRELLLDEGRRTDPRYDRVGWEVGAAMYAGAMAELAQQWLAGTLGSDLDVVVERSVRLLLGGARVRR